MQNKIYHGCDYKNRNGTHKLIDFKQRQKMYFFN